MDSMVRYVSPVNPAVSEPQASMHKYKTGFWKFTIFFIFFFYLNEKIYPHLATILLAIGFSLAAWFFVFEVSRNKAQKESIIFKVIHEIHQEIFSIFYILLKELSISTFSSVFLGFGILFLLLSTGIYV